MARKVPKFEYAIICDDIREEVGNKLSYIGIYGRDIFVPNIPFNFPKLCVIITYKDIKIDDSFSFKIIDPSGKMLGKAINVTITSGEKDYNRISILGRFIPLTINQEGLHKLEIMINDDENRKRVIDFKIIKASPSQ